MSPIDKMIVMPTKLRYKLLVSFCLMSLLPLLAGVYVLSIFVKFPFEMSANSLWMVTLVMLFSLALSCFGYLITRQIFDPITDIAARAKNIAQGKLDESAQVDAGGSDEIEELSKSLRSISRNARELLDKVEKLSMKDKLTGLYNSTYIRERLDEEIHRAIHYQRPCSFALLNIDGFDRYVLKYGLEASDEALKNIAKILGNHLWPPDRAARITKDEFAIIIPDKNKKKAILLVEAISQEIGAYLFSGKTVLEHERLTVCAGVSENPIDGVSADELYIKAQQRLKLSKQKGSQTIEAFS